MNGRSGLEKVILDEEFLNTLASILTFIAGGILSVSMIVTQMMHIILNFPLFLAIVGFILALIGLLLSLWITYHGYVSMKLKKAPALSASALAIVLGAFVNGVAAGVAVIAVILILISEKISS